MAGVYLLLGVVALLLQVLIIRLGLDPLRSEVQKIRVELEARNAADLGRDKA